MKDSRSRVCQFKIGQSVRNRALLPLLTMGKSGRVIIGGSTPPRLTKFGTFNKECSIISKQTIKGAFNVRQFTIKEKDVWVGKQEGKFFNEKDYQKEKTIFMKESRSNIVDWYLKDMKKNKVLLTLVNYKRQD